MTKGQDIEFYKLIARYLVFVIAGLTLLIVAMFAPALEVRVYPVVTEFKIRSVEPVDGGAIVSGSMYKARGECYPIQLTVYAANQNGQISEVLLHANPKKPVVTETETRAWRSRPTGEQDWGPWFLKRPSDFYEFVVFDVVHECHALWTVRTELARVIAQSIFLPEHALNLRGVSPIVKE